MVESKKFLLVNTKKTALRHLDASSVEFNIFTQENEGIKIIY